jgi:hypothetical protein
MSYGLRIWGEDGSLQMDETSFTMRIVLSTLVTFSYSSAGYADFATPGCDASNTVAVVIPIGSYSDTDGVIQFEPQILSGVVRVWRGHRTAVNGRYGSGTQRLIVARFR